MTGDLGIVAFTLFAATVSTAVIAIPGIAAAYWLARHRGHTRGLVETLLALPLVLPPTAVGLMLLYLLRPRGVVGRFLESVAFPVVFTWRGVVIATAVMSFPLLVRSARTAFEEVDPRLLDVARTLGASRVSAFTRVALPLARRGIVAGLLLSFSRALGEFGATILVAGKSRARRRPWRRHLPRTQSVRRGCMRSSRDVTLASSRVGDELSDRQAG